MWRILINGSPLTPQFSRKYMAVQFVQALIPMSFGLVNTDESNGLALEDTIEAHEGNFTVRIQK